MGIGVMEKLLVSVTLIGCLSAAHAADWKIEPSLQLKETWSDNVNLESDDKESDLVSEITPGLTVVADGKRLDIELAATIQNLVYSKDGDRNSTNPNLQAKVNSELLEDHLFLDLTSRIGQTQSGSNLSHRSDSLSGEENFSDVYAYSISPRWEQKIGRIAELEVEYSYDQVDSERNDGDNSQGSADSESNQISISLDNGPGLARFFWHADYRKDKTEYDDQGTRENDRSDTENASFRGGYQLSRSLSFDVIANYENNEFVGNRGDTEPDDNTYGGGVTWTPSRDFTVSVYYNERNDPRPSEDDSFISGEFSWNPTVRTEISGEWGNRFFGETYGLNLSHKSRRTSLDIRYSEDISSFRERFLEQGSGGSLICPIGFTDFFECRPSDVNQPPELGEQFVGSPELLPAISNDTFVSKQLRSSFSIRGVANTITFGLSSEEREYLGDDENEDDWGADITWNWRIGPHTISDLSVTIDERQTDSSSDETIYAYNWALSRQITRKTSLFLQLYYRDSDSDSDQGDSSQFSGYTETRVTLGINMNF